MSKTKKCKRRPPLAKDLSAAALEKRRARDRISQQTVRQNKKKKFQFLKDELKNNRDKFCRLRRLLNGTQQILLL
jgi:hypothetical protein